jgi:hypothetical protein
MSILCLNCRGCGRPEAVRDIRNIVDLHNPMVLFLSETKMGANRSQDLRWSLGFPNAFGVSSVGLSGGLLMLWKNEVLMDLKTYSKYHIDMWVTEDNPLGGGNGGLQVSMVILTDPIERNHGTYFAFSVMNLTSRGCVREILMKHFLIMNSLVVMIVRSGRWKVLER